MQISQKETIFFGCDPEFFFLKKGKVIGSERILPTDGVKHDSGKIIIDGVQAEMNPNADTCRQRLACRIANCFIVADNLTKEHKDKEHLSISVDPLLPIEKAELGDLSDKAKYFGCTPSLNVYDEKNKMCITDSSRYYYRSIGGHIHLGFYPNSEFQDNNKTGKYLSVEVAQKKASDIVKMLDIIVGNTCVLIDRHEGNIERRRVYGRAGEYRLPPHGIEYRTPSSFWLRDYVLMSFVFGLTRIAHRIISSSTDESNFAKRIFEAVDQEKVRQAINNNDFDMAMANFEAIRPILEDIIPNNESEYSLCKSNIPQFLYFVKQGIDKYFPKEKLIDNWKNNYSNLGMGWEAFLTYVIKPEMKSSPILEKLGL